LFEYSIQTISGTPSLVHQVVGIQEMSVFCVCGTNPVTGGFDSYTSPPIYLKTLYCWYYV